MSSASEARAEVRLRGLLHIIGRPAKCERCDAAIFWVRTKNNKPHPIDPTGVTHFATCPNPANYRQARSRPRARTEDLRNDDLANA